MLHLPNSFVLNEGSLAFAFTSQAQDQLRQSLSSHCVVCIRTDPKFFARPMERQAKGDLIAPEENIHEHQRYSDCCNATQTST